MRRRAQNAHQGGIRHVYGRVRHHHHGIGEVGIDNLARLSKIGIRENQIPEYSIGDSHPQQIRSVFAPSCVGTVGEDSHDGIIHRIPKACKEEHRPCNRSIDSENIGIVIKKENVECLKEKV